MAGSHLLRGTLDLLVLQALTREPLHGYGIARRIETATDDALSIEEGSLYPALHRLEERGHVSARWATGSSNRRVRIYSITKAGRRRLADEKKHWNAFVRAVARLVDQE